MFTDLNPESNMDTSQEKSRPEKSLPNTDTSTDIASLYSNKPLNINERTYRRCQTLLQKVAMLPNSNDQSFDFESLVNECRSLYKLISIELHLVNFPPLQEKVATLSW